MRLGIASSSHGGYSVLSDALAEFEKYLLDTQLEATSTSGVLPTAERFFADMPALPENWRSYVPKATL